MQKQKNYKLKNSLLRRRSIVLSIQYNCAIKVLEATKRKLEPFKNQKPSKYLR